MLPADFISSHMLISAMSSVVNHNWSGFLLVVANKRIDFGLTFSRNAGMETPASSVGTMRALAGRRKPQVQRCSEPRVGPDTPISGRVVAAPSAHLQPLAELPEVRSQTIVHLHLQHWPHSRGGMGWGGLLPAAPTHCQIAAPLVRVGGGDINRAVASDEL